MHKHPIEPRFITSGSDCVTSQLSKAVSLCLKRMLTTENNYCKDKFNNYKKFFIIDSHDEIIKHIHDSNSNRSNKSVKSYDFKTLYTKIPHHKLKDTFGQFVRDVFNYNNKFKCIEVVTNTVRFVEKRSSKVSFSMAELIEAINIIIDNSYIKFNSRIYRQIMGIPMGTNCAPHLANIFLHIYEKLFIIGMLQVNTDVARNLKFMFRFQDDLIIFEDNGVFAISFSDIYLPEIILKNTNISVQEVNYLDLNIIISYQDNYMYKSYEKRNDFSFQVINYPNLSGNIPKNPSYGVVISQLVRYTRINLNINTFKEDVIKMVNKLLTQGYLKKNIADKYIHFTRTYTHLWIKFGYDILNPDFVNELF